VVRTRTWREVIEDDVLGLAAQLSYYFFLALFPAILSTPILLSISWFRGRRHPACLTQWIRAYGH